MSVALLAVTVPIFGDIITTHIFLLGEGELRDEDVYVAATSGRIDGTIDGDLVIAVGRLDISGTITGDLLVTSSAQVTITGEVKGSVRGVARSVLIAGRVGDDLAVASANVEVTGEVGRDLFVLAGLTDLSGFVGRDVRGRFFSGTLDAVIDGDVDVSVSALEVGPGAAIGGDLLYRSDGNDRFSGGAQIAGSVQRLPTKATFLVRVWLLGVTILSFLAYVFAGLMMLFTVRTTTARATALVRTAPLRTLWVGLAAIVAFPLVAVTLIVTIVGLPVGLFLLAVWILFLLFASVPAVTAGGDFALRGRGGLFGSFVVGAFLFRSIVWLVPLIGAVVYTLALAMGAGGFVLSFLDQRRRSRTELESLLPPPPSPPPPPAGWEPPLAPAPPSESA